MPTQLRPPTKSDWELWALALSVVAGAWAFVKWPLRWALGWGRRSFQHAVISAVDARSADLRRVIEREFAPELIQREETAKRAEANEDRLTTAQAAIEAHGLVLREVPRMSGIMEGMTKTLDRLDKTIANIGANVLDHGTELGRVSGFLESGNWQGQERRKKGRRSDDPPQHEDDEG